MQINQENIIFKVYNSVTEEGIKGCMARTKRFVGKKVKKYKRFKETYKDVLFISGCNSELPHPWRYRVSHQREELEAYNYTTDEVYYLDLKLEQIRYYRAFIFFRCPYTGVIGEFVKLAKKLNKRVIYDIDDLVIDTKYTDLVKYVQQMDEDAKEAYDKNVMNMQKLLRRCDIAITSTDCLAGELNKYVTRAYVNRNVASEEMQRLSEIALNKRIKDSKKVKIGYFSGSITHNADFELIMPAIKYIMYQYPFVELYLVGEVDVPKYLYRYKERIKSIPFGDWRELPQKIADMDINLAPLENTIFNEAKSENKWIEAALVKVVTVASDVGAFHQSIEQGKTGILCKTVQDWKEEIEKLILHPELRERIAEEAFRYCKENCTTIGNGRVIVEILKKEIKDNYVFVLPGMEISGGMRVALKHASILQKEGQDVTLFLLDGSAKWYEAENCKFPIINIEKAKIRGHIVCAIATMWTTVRFLEQYPNIQNRYYLVQGYETDFYKCNDHLRIVANKTYMAYNNIRYVTISKWCQKWLKEKYDQESLYVPNGLNLESFCCCKRKLTGKIRILIEGDCTVENKNVDEAFQIVDKLDSQKYEIWYLSYNGEPKKQYRVDRFFHKIPYEKVAKIYEECDILLKTSVLESFSYPPLEMMATGGYVVAVPNGGNQEYLEHNYNCLLYEKGNLKEGVRAIEKIVEDKELQEQLFVNGRKTAESREWKKIEDDILKMYMAE